MKTLENFLPKRDKKLAESYRGQPCEICGQIYQTVAHHVISFKSRPDLDIPINLVALCPRHHREAHDRGAVTFVKTYPHFRHLLEDRGFQLFNNKLIPPIVEK